MEKENTPLKLHFVCIVPDKYNPDLSPVIFVHGIVDTSESWSSILSEVAEETKRKVYAIDLRNHGKSEWSENLSNESVCLDIENFMVEHGIKKTIFVSHSFGSRVCMSICLRKPELVEKIVIEDAGLQDPKPKELESVAAMVTLVRGFSILSKTMKESEMRTFLVKRAKEIYPNNPDLASAVYSFAVNQNADGNCQPAFNLDALDKGFKDKSLVVLDFAHFQVFDGPALIIYGTKSQVAVDKDKLLPKYFPNAEYYKVENASHYIHKEYPKEFKTKVCEFINS